MVTTVRPKASATPTRPMPISGNLAARTALTQPPKRSQKVPMNSAPSFFDNGMAEPPIDLRAMRKRQPVGDSSRFCHRMLTDLPPARVAVQQRQQGQRHDDDGSEQNIGDGPADQTAEQGEYRKNCRPGVGDNAARGDAEPAQEQAGQETQDDDADDPADDGHASSAGSRSRSHSALTSGSVSAGRRAVASIATSARPEIRPKAQTAAPRTRGEGSLRQRRAASANPGPASGALPIAISTLRRNRSRPVRLIEVAANSARKPASSSAASSTRRGAVRAARGRKAGSCPARANLFHGQIAKQSSQPKMRLPIAGRSSCGIGPLCSIVR